MKGLKNLRLSTIVDKSDTQIIRFNRDYKYAPSTLCKIFCNILFINKTKCISLGVVRLNDFWVHMGLNDLRNGEIHKYVDRANHFTIHLCIII